MDQEPEERLSALVSDIEDKLSRFPELEQSAIKEVQPQIRQILINRRVYEVLLGAVKDRGSLQLEPAGSFVKPVTFLSESVNNTFDHLGRVNTRAETDNENDITNLRKHLLRPCIELGKLISGLPVIYSAEGFYDVRQDEINTRDAAFSRIERQVTEKLDEELKEFLPALEDATARLNEKGQEYDSALENLSSLKEKAESVINSASQALDSALEASVAKKLGTVGSAYALWSSDHQNSAKSFLNWIGGTVVVIAIIIIVTFIIPKPSGMLSSDFAIMMSFSRVGILALGVTLLVFFGKQYSAAKHAALITAHRSKIAETFMEMGKHCASDSIYESLMLTVASAMFQEPTSPLVKESSGASGLSDVKATLDLIRSQKSGG